MMMRLLFILECVVLVMSTPVLTNMQDVLDVDPWSDMNPDYSEYDYAGGPDINARAWTGGEEDRIDKRGLTSLSRWKPFSIGFNSLLGRYPPRAPLMSMLPGIDFVSAETRGQRPTGQPLRWGR